MTTRPILRNADARRLLMASQGLCAPTRARLSYARLLALIDQLGYVQLDSISTVERAHHMILFARNQTYRQLQLHYLLERERSLFENWTHDAAVIPSRFFPYWQMRFERESKVLLARWREWRRHGFEEELEAILERIRREGPVMARHLGEKGEKKGENAWWDWHPSKTALEYLWRTGALAVTRREGFQKVYDLTERVLPEAYLSSPERDELLDWACREAIGRLRFATAAELADFWGCASVAEAESWCKRQPSDELIEVEVEPAKGSKPWIAYARPDLWEQVATTPSPPGSIRVLSPFDPLIRDRRRCERLFGFRYRIEVFVPEEKRQFGYYVFPLLEGDRLIGRIDMKQQRDQDALVVRALWLEPRLSLTPTRQERLRQELDRQRAFIGAGKVAFEADYLKASPTI